MGETVLNPDKYTRHLLGPPNASATEMNAWGVTTMFAVLPALIVGALAGLSPAGADQIREAAWAWGIGAWAAAVVLKGWRLLTKRFANLPLSTALAIAAVLGAAVGMVGGITQGTPIAFAIWLTCGIAGALQGALVAWFIASPEASAPEEEADDPNPPTSSP
jgi:hypothetical protein